jgi:hypothetical protein
MHSNFIWNYITKYFLPSTKFQNLLLIALNLIISLSGNQQKCEINSGLSKIYIHIIHCDNTWYPEYSCLHLFNISSIYSYKMLCMYWMLHVHNFKLHIHGINTPWMYMFNGNLKRTVHFTCRWVFQVYVSCNHLSEYTILLQYSGLFCTSFHSRQTL